MKKLLLYFLSVFLFVLSVPAFDCYYLAWFAFVPFFLLILDSRRKIRDSFSFGLLLAGTIYGFFLIIYGGNDCGKIGLYVLAVLLLASMFALWGYLIGLFQKKLKSKVFLAALIALSWLALEYFSINLLQGISIYPGLTQHNNYVFLKLAKCIGLYGISALVIFINACWALLIKAWRREKLKEYKWSGLILILPLLALLFFNANLAKEEVEQEGVDRLNVSIIQGNISYFTYKQAGIHVDRMDAIFNKYLALSEQALEEYPSDVLVWAETSVHRYLLRNKFDRERLLDFVKDKGVYLILGTPDLTEDGDEFNSVYVLSPQGTILASYRKNILVPVWEKSFSKGKGNEAIETPAFKAAINICWEALFPGCASRQIKKGADLLFILSNNGLLGYNISPYFTSAFSVFRAAENNRPAIQSMNTGISSIVSAEGRVLANTQMFTEALLHGSIPMKKRTITFYSRYGDYVYTLLLIFLSTYVLISLPLFNNFSRKKFKKRDLITGRYGKEV